MLPNIPSIAGHRLAHVAKNRLDYLPGKMIVRVKEEAVRAGLGAATLKFTEAVAGLLPAVVSAPLDYLRQNAGLTSVVPLFSKRQGQVAHANVATASRHGLAMLSSVADSTNEDLSGFAALEIDAKKMTPALLKHLRSSKGIELLEPMPARWLAAKPAATAADPLQNRQWGLRMINWFTASIPAATGINVGVMDTGIDQKHPDLHGVSLNYRHAGLKAADLLGHGTHVSGIIAAVANNQVGITGVASCALTVWKIFPDQPESDGEFYVDGQRYLQALAEARQSGIRVLNLSIGGTASSQTEQLLFRRLETAGVVVVAAMGNEFEEGNPTEYPGAYPTVLAIGSVAENGKRSYFSNTGSHIALCAPGSNILSTLPMKKSKYLDETEYAAWSGTSMATPHVSAAAALVAAKFPQLKPDAIKLRLKSKARKLSAMKGKTRTDEYGSGLLDLAACL